jgi:hypothetical protein
MDMATLHKLIREHPDSLTRDALEILYQHMEDDAWPEAIAARIADEMDDLAVEDRDMLREVLASALKKAGREVYEPLIGSQVIEEDYFEDCAELGTL